MGRSSAAPLHGSGADGELDFAAARFHFFEGVGEILKANLFGDEIVREDVAAANGFERLSNEARRVMGWGDELDLRIGNRGRFDLPAGARLQALLKIPHAIA